MRSGVKAAIVVLVTLPMLAYVAGRLAAAPPEPGPRSPVILDDPGTPSTSPSPSPDAPDRDGDADDGVRVVNPAPTRVGEDDGDDQPPEDDQTDDDTTGGD